MKLTVVRLSDEQHEGLRTLAFDQKTSIAELIRKAIERVYGEDIEDIRDGEAALAEYRANPESATPYEEFRKEWLTEHEEQAS